MIVALAVIAFFLGTFFGGQKEVVLDKTALPDTIEVGGVNFSNGPKAQFFAISLKLTRRISRHTEMKITVRSILPRSAVKLDLT